MANDKKVGPSITKMGGQGGEPGDSVHFWHVGRKDFLSGVIDSVEPTRYAVIWADCVIKPTQTIKQGYKTFVLKQNCIIYKGK